VKTKTINISFPDEFLAEIDRVAKKESRSRSELLREAIRIYIERKERWRNIFATSDFRLKRKNLTEADILEEIATHRKEKQ
jgi:CopG family transcriptional regulator / antitoxin EndoAI